MGAGCNTMQADKRNTRTTRAARLSPRAVRQRGAAARVADESLRPMGAADQSCAVWRFGWRLCAWSDLKRNQAGGITRVLKDILLRAQILTPSNFEDEKQTSPSSASRRASVPSSSQARRMSSSQTLCPNP